MAKCSQLLQEVRRLLKKPDTRNKHQFLQRALKHVQSLEDKEAAGAVKYTMENATTTVSHAVVVAGICSPRGGSYWVHD